MKIDMHSHLCGGDPLDALVAQVVSCGGVMSQIVDTMVASQSTGRSAPDAPPIPDVLHELLRGVLEPLAATHSECEIEETTAMLAEITQSICEEIFLLPSLDADA